MIDRIESALRRLRAEKPLVLCLTNVVTMDFMANCLLALGAAPLMTVDADELEELVHISQAVTLNLGTLDAAMIQRCHQAAAWSQQQHKPLVLDPVGAGASKLRTHAAQELAASADIIRGNASEIMALARFDCRTRGVESTRSVDSAKEAASILAHTQACTVVVSGPEDFIVNDSQQTSLFYGSALMPLVTGMGCTLTAVIAAFRAVEPDPFEASLLAAAFFALCGHVSELKSKQPGSFRVAFIDALYAADFDAMREII